MKMDKSHVVLVFIDPFFAGLLLCRRYLVGWPFRLCCVVNTHRGHGFEKTSLGWNVSFFCIFSGLGRLSGVVLMCARRQMERAVGYRVHLNV